jgi:A/G-specific adenine glycosylase
MVDGGVRQFRDTVWDYYHEHGRHDLAWRLDTSPYSILVSEVMLQQTQVSRVVVKYREFLSAFPDVKSLAAASISEVLTAWQGLGYNRRGLWLQQAAVKIMADCGGKVPSDPAELVKLPGIGPNTAGSIAAFAYNAPVVFIETNIRRVYIHHFFADQLGVADAELLPIIEATLDRESPREWYWALMDYGSDLAKQVPNPNRQSKHYTKQAKFEGSDRQLRGEILRQLLAKPKAIDELIEQLDKPTERVEKILAGLIKDGLIIRTGNELKIS